MYIKLAFQMVPWVVHQSAGGIQARLIAQPELISELPEAVKANIYCEPVKKHLTNEIVGLSYYHDCKELSQAQVEDALALFSSHYNNYKDGMPSAELVGKKSTDNELIINLTIAVSNICNQENNPLLSNNSGNAQDIFERAIL